MSASALRQRVRDLAWVFGVTALYLAPSWLYEVQLLARSFGSSVLLTLVWDVAFAGVALVALRRRGDACVQGSSVMRPRADATDVLVLAGITVAVFFVGNLAGTCVLNLTGDVAFTSYTGRMQASGLVLEVLLSCVVAPVTEEVLMRGLVFGTLRRSWSFALSACAQAGLFAAIHGTLVHVPMTVMLGLFCAVLVERYRSVVPAICAHGLSNALTTFVLPTLTVGAWMVEPFAVCALTLGVLAVLGVLMALVSRGAWYHG